MDTTWVYQVIFLVKKADLSLLVMLLKGILAAPVKKHHCQPDSQTEGTFSIKGGLITR